MLSAIVSVTWQPLVIGMLRLGFSCQLQGFIGRLCLTFDVGGLLWGPVEQAELAAQLSSAVWPQRRPW